MNLDSKSVFFNSVKKISVFIGAAIGIILCLGIMPVLVEIVVHPDQNYLFPHPIKALIVAIIMVIGIGCMAFLANRLFGVFDNRDDGNNMPDDS